MRMLVEELTTSRKWLMLMRTSDQTENPGLPRSSHRIASPRLNSSWMLRARRGKWQTRKTRTKPMKMAARLSSKRRRRSFWLRVCGTREKEGGGFKV